MDDSQEPMRGLQGSTVDQQLFFLQHNNLATLKLLSTQLDGTTLMQNYRLPQISQPSFDGRAKNASLHELMV